MKRLYLFPFLLLLLASCNQNNEESMIQTAIAETKHVQPTSTLTELPASTPTITLTPTSTSTPTPSFTNTPIPFSQLNLEELTILEGDLPSGWNPMDASNEVPGLLDDVIPGNYSISRSFKSGEYTISVTIFVYENKDNVGLAYEQFIDLSKNVGMEPEETSEVGEKGFIYNGKLYAYPVVVMGFSRCHSAVFLTSGGDDLDALLGYAQKLDNSLIDFVCR